MILIQIAGHLGADPEVRFTPNGQKVTTFRVATNIRKGTKEKTVWWRVTLWGDRFDRKLQYLKKGSPVIVAGDMGIPEIYQDKEGNPQTSFEITAEYLTFSPFGSKSDRQDADNQDSGNQQGRNQGANDDDSNAPFAQANQKFAGRFGVQAQPENNAKAFAPAGFTPNNAASPRQAGASYDAPVTDDDIPF